jgi:prolyl oligopeptidase
VFSLSNGGLLPAVMGAQRPDFFGAVVSDVPLTDMLGFPKMGMGSAWITEYGDPEDPEMVKMLVSYSPFHNVRNDAQYPPFLVTVSTKDDRVGAGHPRKLVARLKDSGAAKCYLSEERDGGHGVSDAFKKTELMSRRMSFFVSTLMGQHPYVR